MLTENGDDLTIADSELLHYSVLRVSQPKRRKIEMIRQDAVTVLVAASRHAVTDPKIMDHEMAARRECPIALASD